MTTPQQWQPIETAPKDATDILGWRKDYFVEKTWFSLRLKQWVFYDDDCDLTNWEPTHWIPLPAPPK